jgi:hypothetical protein
MKRVYVAGLYSRYKDGSKANVVQVLDNMRAGYVASLKILRAGYAVFCPWLDFQFGLIDDEPIPAGIYKENSMEWLRASDVLVVISGVGLGTGVDAEIKEAERLKKPIYYSVDDFLWR